MLLKGKRSKIVVVGNNKACCLSSCRHVYGATQPVMSLKSLLNTSATAELLLGFLF